MSRKDNFSTDSSGTEAYKKSLRYYAREAAEYLTGIPYLPPKALEEPTGRPGRGVSGESSN
jgi:hypothetical protein